MQNRLVKPFPFRAVSNTFDYTVTLEGGPGDPDTVLRGVDERADLGLLSLFEHYQGGNSIETILA